MQNFIVEFKQALSRNDCQRIIKKFENDPNKKAGRTGAGVDKQKKDSEDLYISTLESWQEECAQINGLIFQAFCQYAKAFPFIITGAVAPSIRDPKDGSVRSIHYDEIANLNDSEIATLAQSIYTVDAINLQKYRRQQGGYHHWHSEHFPHPSDPQQKSLHRVLLWLIYLNDVDQGGETEFFYQQAKVKPSAGSLVLAPCGFTHTHRGCVPQSNDKYVLASWVRYKDAKALYGV